MYLKTHLGLESFILQKGNKERVEEREELNAVRGAEQQLSVKNCNFIQYTYE